MLCLDYQVLIKDSWNDSICNLSVFLSTGLRYRFSDFPRCASGSQALLNLLININLNLF